MRRLAMHLAVSLVAIFVASHLPGADAAAQQWTRFRGPNGTGVSSANSIPATWSESDYNWKIELPGLGHSSPSIWGDKIFLLSATPEDATRHVLCIGAGDGEILWQRDYKGARHHLHERSSYASCTPAVDADHVYVAWSDPDHTWLRAFKHDGQEAWTLDMGPWVSQHGFGTSPIVYGDLVILQNSQEPSKRPNTPAPNHSSVVAADRKTGEVRWQTPRKIDTASYSVPSVFKNDRGEDELIFCSTAEGIFSLDPGTGKENWSIDVFTMRTVSSPILAGGLLFGSTGSGGGGNYVVAVRPGNQPEVAYEVKTQAPYVPTPVALGELVFLWYDKGGFVTCIDASSGKVHWRQRVGEKSRGEFSGSPVIVDGKVYAIDEDGVVVVLAADKQYKLLGQNPLGEPSRSTPAVSGGRMYLRTYSHLISIGGKAT